jgi:hypothetical protein
MIPVSFFKPVFLNLFSPAGPSSSDMIPIRPLKFLNELLSNPKQVLQLYICDLRGLTITFQRTLR